MRLIDADTPLETLKERAAAGFVIEGEPARVVDLKACCGVTIEKAYEIFRVMSLLCDRNSTDIVPVVRCKDCRFINRCSHNPFNGNFYCADGERI